MAERHLSVSLLTPERVLYDGEATDVVVPLHDGEAGILPRHATMVARLGAGVTRIRHQGEDIQTYVSFVCGGFVQVANDVITILTDEAQEPGHVDRAEAQSALEAALAVEAQGEKALLAKENRIAIARARLRHASENDK